MTGAQELKEAQRKAGTAARTSLTRAEQLRYSAMIAEKIVQSEAYRRANMIFTYQPFRGEMDISLFNQRGQADGKLVAYPICSGAGRMVAAIPQGPEAWEEGKYGIRTPIAEKSRIVDPNEIDLVVAPCTAFDAQCMRIGWGGGYYDRYLPQCGNAVRLAVAYENQRVDRVSSDHPWDFVLDGIVTEHHWYEKESQNTPV